MIKGLRGGGGDDEESIEGGGCGWSVDKVRLPRAYWMLNVLVGPTTSN